jgi:hypothetical protein
MSGESGAWTVDDNEDDTALVLSFSHIGDDGVETFDTAMPYECAMAFGQTIVDWCKDKV